MNDEWTLGFVLANVGVQGEKGLHKQVRPSSSPSKIPGSSTGSGSLVVASLNKARVLMASFRSLLASFFALLSWRVSSHHGQ